MKSLYMFQDWQLGEVRIDTDDYDRWVKKVEDKSIDGIYEHTDDNKDAFLYMSFDYDKLKDFATKRKNNFIRMYESEVRYLKSIPVELY